MAVSTAAYLAETSVVETRARYCGSDVFSECARCDQDDWSEDWRNQVRIRCEGICGKKS